MTQPPANAKQLTDFPSAPGLPLVGNAVQLLFNTKAVHKQFERWEHELGPSYTVQALGKRTLVTSDQRLIRRALHDRPDTFRRVSNIEVVSKELGFNGVFSAEGAAWEPQSKFVAQGLHTKHLPAFFPTLRAITDRLRRRWLNVASGRGITDTVQDLTKFTVDVTSTLAFGQDPNTLESDGDLIQRHLSVIFPILAKRTLSPIPYWHVLPNFRLNRAIEQINKSIDGFIDQTEREISAQPEMPTQNLLQALVRAARSGSSDITKDTVRANILTILLAGEDTTAHAIAWSLYFLADKPDLQRQLQKQAREILGDSRIAPDYQTTDRLQLFEGLAREALRFKPIIPLIGLETKRDTCLEEVWLPAGTGIFLDLRSGMKDETNFPDADRFEPERWTSAGRYNQQAFLQFGAGPRVCPGRTLAYREIRSVLSMVSRNFSIEFASDPKRIRERFAFTMRPNALRLRFQPLA